MWTKPKFCYHGNTWARYGTNFNDIMKLADHKIWPLGAIVWDIISYTSRVIVTFVFKHPNFRYKCNNDRSSEVLGLIPASKTRKPCCYKQTARCRSCSLPFKVRRQHSLYKFKSSQASNARLQSSKHTCAKQNLTLNGHSRSSKVTCFGVSGKAIRD